MELEKLSYLILLAGTGLDQISTRIALTNPNTYELNEFAVSLMNRGLWLPFDILLVSISVLVCSRIVKMRYGKAVLVYPLLLGLIRMGAGIWNLSLIFST